MKNKGFTLIETIIYIALFSIIMGGLMVSVYQLIQSTGSTNSKVIAENEINFVLKKIDWVLTGAEDINSPSSGTDDELSVDKNGYALNPIEIRINGDGKIELENSAETHILTTENVKVDSISFEYLKVGNTEGIKATVTIDGTSATLTKYLHL